MNRVERTDLRSRTRALCLAGLKGIHEYRTYCDAMISAQEDRLRNLPPQIKGADKGHAMAVELESLKSIREVLDNIANDYDRIAAKVGVAVKYEPEPMPEEAEKTLSEGRKGAPLYAIIPVWINTKLKAEAAIEKTSKTEMICRALVKYWGDGEEDKAGEDGEED